MSASPTSKSRNRHWTLVSSSSIDSVRQDTVKGTQPCAEQRKRVVSLTVSESWSPGLEIPVELEMSYRQELSESHAVVSKVK